MLYWWFTFLQKEEIGLLYANASIGAIPSQYEELGLVALEMMMFALPIVANESTGLSDILLNSKAGQLVRLDYKDKSVAINLLADTVIKFLMDENLQMRYKVNARNHFLRSYTDKIFEERMLKIYKS